MKILVVDDDRVLADIVAYTYRREGFEVILAYDGPSALEAWLEKSPDLIVLDINLPGMDGFSICKQIRQESSIPILMLTVRGEDNDVVYGFELGADDYIPKPFSPRQLVARTHAVLRRSRQPTPPSRSQVGDLCLEPTLREVRVGVGNPIQLSEQESRLLEYLMQHAGQIVSGEDIYRYIWGSKESEQGDLRQLIRRLRNKIEPNPAKPIYIKNVPGLGYGLVVPS